MKTFCFADEKRPVPKKVPHQEELLRASAIAVLQGLLRPSTAFLNASVCKGVQSGDVNFSSDRPASAPPSALRAGAHRKPGERRSLCSRLACGNTSGPR